MASKFFCGWTGTCLLALLSSASLPVPATAQAPAYIAQWGTEGMGSGQFHDPWHITVDHEGNVYVGDWTARIQKFNGEGVFLTQWGTDGSGFNAPATDVAGNVYVSDFSVRIQKFTATGTFLTEWAVPSPSVFTLNRPRALTVDAAGAVYVAYSNFETGKKGIFKFTGTGVLITEWSPGGEARGLATDAAGNVYATVAGNIKKFTSDGAPLTQWSVGEGINGSIYGIAVDAENNVYVSDAGNDRIQKYTSEGTLLAQWGSLGSGNGQFIDPRGVAADAEGNVYVVDSVNQRIQKFGYVSTPTKATSWGRLKRMYR